MKLIAPGNDGKPQNDEEHCWIQQETRRINRKMPTFLITREFHDFIHQQEKNK